MCPSSSASPLRCLKAIEYEFGLRNSSDGTPSFSEIATNLNIPDPNLIQTKRKRTASIKESTYLLSNTPFRITSCRQGFINVFFFLFLDERNNRVRVTNCQSPLSPTQFFDLRRQRQLSDHPPLRPWRSKFSIFRARRSL